MNTKILNALALAASMLHRCVIQPGLAQAQETKSPYPAMAPLDQYLIADHDAEIALAKSAAPPALSNDASVLVLAKDGYHTAIEGKNGFTCLVERSWMAPIDSTDFWNPKLRGPVCYNPPAVRTILPYTILRTKLILNGLTKDQMVENIQSSLAASLLPIARAGSHVVHDVEEPISRRQPRALASTPNVSSPPHGRRELGCEPARVPGCYSTRIIKRGRSRRPSLWFLSIIGLTELRQCPLIPLCINIDCLLVAPKLLALAGDSLRVCRKDRAGQETKQMRNCFPRLVLQDNCN